MVDSPPPYTPNTGNLKKFLENIPKTGVPSKLTQEYLAKLGYKSSNDRRIIVILKFIGFLQSDGTPTDEYRQFRNTETSKFIMASCVKSSYTDLFNTYPNANEKDDEALVNIMRPTSDAKQKTLAYAVRTFKVLCSFADFSSTENIDGRSFSVTPLQDQNSTPKAVHAQGDSPFVLNVNIQVTLPETKDYDVYDKIFESLRKHLLSEKSEDSS